MSKGNLSAISMADKYHGFNSRTFNSLKLPNRIVMKTLNTWFTRNAFNLLRISIGVIYLWFGALKYFPDLSPADQLAKDTICLLTFGLIPTYISIKLLAIWETVLGLLLIIGVWRKEVYIALLVHMFCTFIPLFYFEDISFTATPYAFTLVGQYIMKNLIIICAVLVLQAHNRGRILLVPTQQ